MSLEDYCILKGEVLKCVKYMATFRSDKLPCFQTACCFDLQGKEVYSIFYSDNFWRSIFCKFMLNITTSFPRKQ